MVAQQGDPTFQEDVMEMRPENQEGPVPGQEEDTTSGLVPASALTFLPQGDHQPMLFYPPTRGGRPVVKLGGAAVDEDSIAQKGNTKGSGIATTAALQERIEKSKRSLSVPSLKSAQAQFRYRYEKQTGQLQPGAGASSVLNPRPPGSKTVEVQSVVWNGSDTAPNFFLPTTSRTASSGAVVNSGRRMSLPPTLAPPKIATAKLNVARPEPKFEKLLLGQAPVRRYDAVNPILDANTGLQPPENLLRENGDRLARSLPPTTVARATNRKRQTAMAAASGPASGRKSLLRLNGALEMVPKVQLEAGQPPLLKDAAGKPLKTQLPIRVLGKDAGPASALNCVAGPVSPKSERGRFSPLSRSKQSEVSPRLAGKVLDAEVWRGRFSGEITGADGITYVSTPTGGRSLKRAYSGQLLTSAPKAGMTVKQHQALVELMRKREDGHGVGNEDGSVLEPDLICAIVCRELLARLEGVMRKDPDAHPAKVRKMVRGVVPDVVFSLLANHQESQKNEISRLLASVFVDRPNPSQTARLEYVRFLAGEACSSDRLERMARSLSDLVSKVTGSDFDMQEALDDHVVQGVAAQLVRATQKLCYGAVSKNESSALDAVKKELVDKVTTLEQLGKTLQNHIEQDSESAFGEMDETKKMLKNTPVREWGTDEVVDWLSTLAELPERSFIVDLFRHHKMDGLSLIALDEGKLQQMGILTFGTRRHLAIAIRDLRVEAAGQSLELLPGGFAGAAGSSNTSSARVLNTPSAKSDISTIVLRVGLHNAKAPSSSTSDASKAAARPTVGLDMNKLSESISAINAGLSPSSSKGGGAQTKKLLSAQLPGLSPRQMPHVKLSEDEEKEMLARENAKKNVPFSIMGAIDTAAKNLRDHSPASPKNRENSPANTLFGKLTARVLQIEPEMMDVAAQIRENAANRANNLSSMDFSTNKDKPTPSAHPALRLSLPVMDMGRLGTSMPPKKQIAVQQLREQAQEQRARSAERMREQMRHADLQFEQVTKLSPQDVLASSRSRMAGTTGSLLSPTGAGPLLLLGSKGSNDGANQAGGSLSVSLVSSERNSLVPKMRGVPPLGANDLVTFVDLPPEGEYIPPAWRGKTGWISGPLVNGKVRVTVYGQAPGTRESAELSTTVLVPVLRSNVASPESATGASPLLLRAGDLPGKQFYSARREEALKPKSGTAAKTGVVTAGGPPSAKAKSKAIPVSRATTAAKGTSGNASGNARLTKGARASAPPRVSSPSPNRGRSPSPAKESSPSRPGAGSSLAAKAKAVRAGPPPTTSTAGAAPKRKSGYAAPAKRGPPAQLKRPVSGATEKTAAAQPSVANPKPVSTDEATRSGMVAAFSRVQENPAGSAPPGQAAAPKQIRSPQAAGNSILLPSMLVPAKLTSKPVKQGLLTSVMPPGKVGGVALQTRALFYGEADVDADVFVDGDEPLGRTQKQLADVTVVEGSGTSTENEKKGVSLSAVVRTIRATEPSLLQPRGVARVIDSMKTRRGA